MLADSAAERADPLTETSDEVGGLAEGGPQDAVGEGRLHLRVLAQCAGDDTFADAAHAVQRRWLALDHRGKRDRRHRAKHHGADLGEHLRSCDVIRRQADICVEIGASWRAPARGDGWPFQVVNDKVRDVRLGDARLFEMEHARQFARINGIFRPIPRSRQQPVGGQRRQVERLGDREDTLARGNDRMGVTLVMPNHRAADVDGVRQLLL